MSAGDIDDELGTDEELHKLSEEFPEFNAYANRQSGLPINREYDIPFGAGISRDGSIRYVDRHMHTRFHGADIVGVLATHESIEWALRKYAQVGLDYQTDPRGHELANRAEFNALMRVFDSPPDLGLWREYCNFIDPQVKRDETESIEKVPPDLDLYPYAGTKMEKALVNLGARVASSNSNPREVSQREPSSQGDISAIRNRPSNKQPVKNATRSKGEKEVKI